MSHHVLDQIATKLRNVTASETKAFELTLALVANAARKRGPTSNTLENRRTHCEAVGINTVIDTHEGLLQEAEAEIGKLFDPHEKIEVQDHARGFANAISAGVSIEDYLPSTSPGVFVLPRQLADLMCSLAELGSDETAYAPWDLVGQLATRLSSVGNEVFVETPIRSNIPAFVQSITGLRYASGNFDPITNPSAVSSGELRKFDVAVAFPPIGARYPDAYAADRYQRFPAPTPSSTVLALWHVMHQVRRRAVVLVPNSLLSSSGVEELMRTGFLRKGAIEAVIGMPPGVLRSSAMQLGILILDPRGGHETVRFVDTESASFTSPRSRGRNKIVNVEQLVRVALRKDNVNSSSQSVDVPVEVLLGRGANLLTRRYILQSPVQQAFAQVTSEKRIILGDLVTTIRSLPIAVSKKQMTDKNAGIQIGEIGALDLPKYGSISTPGRTLTFSPTVTERCRPHYLYPWDIVLIIKGTVGKVGIVPPSLSNAYGNPLVVGQSAIVLRIKDQCGVDPRALFMQLRSPLGQKLLAGVVAGTTTPLIQIKELMALPILSPSAEDQKKSVSVLELEDEIQAQIDSLMKQQETSAAELWALP